MKLLFSPDVYAKAWEFSTLAHQGQLYGSKTEGVEVNYLNHIGSVAMEVICALQRSPIELNADLAIQCALLHDVIEDTKYSHEDLVSKFGKEVANGVLALTKNDELASGSEKMNDSLSRIKTQPHEVWMVKMADRICNLQQPPHHWNDEKILYYQKEALIIYDSLKESDIYLSERLKNKILKYSDFTNSKS